MKNVHIIINPKNITQNQSLIESINTIVAESSVSYAISLTSETHSIEKILDTLEEEVETILIYGGDGSISEIVDYIFTEDSHLYKRDLQIGILPGGTANVLSKEIGNNNDPIASLKTMLQGNYEAVNVDLGTCNGIPFFLRVSVGLMAEMVTDTTEEAKTYLGMFSYAFSVIKRVVTKNVKTIRATIKIEGESIKVKGASMIINNSGNVGIEGISYFQDISITDGLLDILLLKDTSMLTLAKNSAKKVIGNDELQGISRWRTKQALIKFGKLRSVIIDDREHKLEQLDIKIKAKALKMIFPTK